MERKNRVCKEMEGGMSLMGREKVVWAGVIRSKEQTAAARGGVVQR